MKKRFAALTLLAMIGMFGHSAIAAPSTGSYRCDTWHRRSPVGTKYRYTDHTAPDSEDVHVTDPTNPSKNLATIQRGTADHEEDRFGVVTKNFWLEALGGNGYGSNGYPYPSPDTAEGGVVQGDVHPVDAGAPDVVDFSVWSFSLDDEGDNKSFHDTYTGGCVSVAGNTASVGKPPSETQPAYNSTTKTGCALYSQTSTKTCWSGPTGNCDATGTLCDQGVVLPTHMVPRPVAVVSDAKDSIPDQPQTTKSIPPEPRAGE